MSFGKDMNCGYRKLFPKIEFELRAGRNGDEQSLAVTVNGKCALVLKSSEQAKIKSEVLEWFEFLNMTLGAFCFLGAIAVQGTPNPPLNALLSIGWAIILYTTQASRFFPSHRVNELVTYKLEHWKSIRKALVGRYLTGRSIFLNGSFFLIGFFYLIFISVLGFPALSGDFIGDDVRRIFLPADYVVAHPMAVKVLSEKVKEAAKNNSNKH